MRNTAKRFVEGLLTRSGAVGWGLRRIRPSGAILAYHNIVPRGDRPVGDRSLHLDQPVFGDQLDLLLETHDVVPLDELLEEPRPGGRPHRAAITFDDGYRGTLTAGLEELVARGIPATVFVCPGRLGLEGFWWDRLADPETGVLDPDVRSHALQSLAGRHETVLEWAAQSGLVIRDVPSHAQIADRVELDRAASDALVSFGSHTWSHPSLAAVEDAAVELEVRRALEWLRESGLPWTPWLAYPYGLAPAGGLDGAGEGYRGAVLVDGGLARRRGAPVADPFLVPRLNVPRGLTTRGLALRLAGVVTSGQGVS